MKNAIVKRRGEKSIGVGLLSWQAHKTLAKTLANYAEQDFFTLFDDAVLIFQDPSPEDFALAEKYSLRFTTAPNRGIASGMERIALSLETHYVLLLQEDCVLIESYQEAQRQIRRAIDMLEDGEIDMMRLRSRIMPGDGGMVDVKNYCRYFVPKQPEEGLEWPPQPSHPAICRIRRLLWPRKAHHLKGAAIYVEKSAEKIFPNDIRKTKRGVWIAPAALLDWTDQPTLIGRDFFLSEVMGHIWRSRKVRLINGFVCLEKSVDGWWAKQDFKIGVGEGIFTHNRFEGGFRKKLLAEKMRQG